MEHLSRRALLAAAAAATTAAVTAPLVPAAQPVRGPRAAAGPLRRPKKAVKLGMVAGDAAVAAKFALLKECGFDGVELDSPSSLGRDEVLAAKASSGLEIPGVVDSVHWGKPFSSPDATVRAEGRKALETALRDARAYGGTSVLVVPAVVSKQVSYLDAWRRSHDEIVQLVPLAKELQVQILIENVWNGFLLGPTELVAYIDEFADPIVGSHFDAGNLVKFGYPEQWVPILGKRIRKVDVKEFDRKRGSFDARLNDGDADWPAIVRALRAIGYDGWFTAEMQGGDGAYLRDLAQRMDAFLQP